MTLLRDPGLPADAPRQILHKALMDTGLTYVVFGAGGIEECYRTAVGVIPILRTTELGPVDWLGSFPDDRAVCWVALQSDAGSAIAVLCGPSSDDDFCKVNIDRRFDLARLRRPWQWGLAFLDGNAPTGFADIYVDADVVPIWQLSEMSALRPSEAVDSSPGVEETSPPALPGSERAVALPDPRDGGNDAAHDAFVALSSVGLSILVYGASDLVSCYRAALAAAPVFGATRTENGWTGTFPQQDGVHWFGVDGPTGSAIAVACSAGADVEFLQSQIVEPLEDLSHGWTLGFGEGKHVPPEFAAIFAGAEQVEIWKLPGLEYLQRASTGAGSAGAPHDLRRDLRSDGWLHLGMDNFSREVTTGDGVTTVWFGPWQDTCAVRAAVGGFSDGAAVHALAANEAQPYRVEFDPDTGPVVVRAFDADTRPSADRIREYADELAVHVQAIRRHEPRSHDSSDHDTAAPAVRGQALTAPAAGTGRTEQQDRTDWYGETTRYDESRAYDSPRRRSPVGDDGVTGYASPWSRASAHSPGAAFVTAYEPAVPTPAPPQSNGAPDSPTRQRARRATVLGGIVAAAAVLAIVITVVAIGLPDRQPSGGTTIDAGAEPAGTAAVTNCPSDPRIRFLGSRTVPDGLLVTLGMAPSCVEGDVLASSSVLLSLSASGEPVASGVFDLSTAPIVLPRPESGSDGEITELSFLYPPGTFWRTPDTAPLLRSGSNTASIAVGYQETGPTSAAAAGAQAGAHPDPIRAVSAGPPSSGDAESASMQGLRAIVDADRGPVSALLADRWIPQLSSKRLGILADGISWNYSEILREHLALRLRYPDARLLWSGDWNTFSYPDYWITVAGQTFSDPPGALQWCRSNGFDRDHCYAKLVSRTHAVEGSTALQPG